VRAGGDDAPDAAIKVSVFTDLRQTAHHRVLSEDADSSPLARLPCDLRHSCLSTWLAGQVDFAQIAAWVGNSVAVLHRVYTYVPPGRDDITRQRIEGILRPSTPAQPPEDYADESTG
jgi:hypothetical protein